MNMDKIAEYLAKQYVALEEEYQALEEDAQMCGPMCYEDRQRRDYACYRRESIKKELATITQLMGDDDENKR